MLERFESQCPGVALFVLCCLLGLGCRPAPSDWEPLETLPVGQWQAPVELTAGASSKLAFLPRPDTRIRVRMASDSESPKGTPEIGVSFETPSLARRELCRSPAGNALLLCDLPPEARSDIVELTLHNAGSIPATIQELRVEAPVRPSPSLLDSAPRAIVIYLVDTLRADRLGAYGSDLGLTPNLDRLAAESVTFLDASANSSWTRSSVASLLTGLLPPSHGTHDREDKLPESLVTLAERLQDLGWDTAAIITNGNVGREFGFQQGFDHFEQTTGGIYAAEVVHEMVFSYLESRSSSDRPLFLYVHTIDPHAPYLPTDEFRERLAPGVDAELGELDRLRELSRMFHRNQLPAETQRAVEALYHAEIAYSDFEFGKFLERLHEQLSWEETLFVFTSDHGEEFWEHGVRGHGHNLHVETLHVPLLIKPPGSFARMAIADPVQLVDVTTTVLDYAGSDPGPALPGRSLRGTLHTGDAPAPEVVRAHLDLGGRWSAAALTPRWKLLRSRHADGQVDASLFDRSAEPAERAAATPPPPVAARFLALSLDQFLELPPLGSETTTDLPEEIDQQLRALGYIE